MNKKSFIIYRSTFMRCDNIRSDTIRASGQYGESPFKGAAGVFGKDYCQREAYAYDWW